jgi:ABC-2 type transport system permease protein
LTVWLIVKKNIKIFLADRKGLAISLALPILLASIMGLTFGGFGGKKKTRALPVAVVDLDGSDLSRKLVASLASAEDLAVTEMADVEEARLSVLRREQLAALVIEKHTGARLRGFFYSDEKAEFGLLADPSRTAETGMLQGILMEKTMALVSGQIFNAGESVKNMRRGLEAIEKDPDMSEEEKKKYADFFSSGISFFDTLPGLGGGSGVTGENLKSRLSRPFSLRVEGVTGAREKQLERFNMMAQTFAGTGVMFLLFTVLDGALAFIRERQRRTLRRLLAAPVRRSTILLGESGAYFLLALTQLVILFGFAKIVFAIPFYGSVPAMILVALSTCWAVTGFGILIATVGRTEKQVQGISILVILVMSALGGSMLPLFMMPEFMQRVASITITKWAVHGLEAVTWRGLPFVDVLPAIAVLSGFGTGLFFLALLLSRRKSWG